MSEKEKKRRSKYRKNREKLIFTQTVIAIVVALAVLISALVAYQLEKTYYIGYREGGNIDYNVFLKENDFYEEDFLEKDQSYVASLIDKIIADFSYQIDMDTDDVNYRYSYTIKSRLEIIDNTSSVAIFNPEYELVSVQNKSQSSSNRLTINEIVVLDYDQYNSLAGNFLSTYDLTNTTSNIVVTLEVDVLSDCNAFSGSSAETYFSELRIPLTTKTVNIKMTSTIPDDEAKMIACTRGAGSEVFKTTAIVLAVVDAILILILVAFIFLTRTEDITYTARVKKIVSQYKSYIQRIKNIFDTSGYQVIVVESFDEMLEIRDTIQAPILMHENDDKTCAKFIIPTDTKILYLFEIKIEGYTEPEPDPKPDPQPTTIVKPNITNVVRPVVKVVVTPKVTETKAEEIEDSSEPEAEIETVVEEPEILVDAAEEIPEVAVETEIEEEPVEEEPVEEEPIEEEPIEAEPIEEEPIEAEPVEEEPVEEELDIEDILDSIPEVAETAEERLIVEAPGVDAIDVVWQERKEKRYRYDPDGNTVDAGDVVLVPTRDVASDKDVVREAEVARGNYKVDPSELETPLKKIIGVVRRKAEKAFVAMITPDEKELEENTDNSEN